MKLFMFLIGKKKKQESPTLASVKEKLLIKEGREQFKKLLDRGLGLPIALG